MKKVMMMLALMAIPFAMQAQTKFLLCKHRQSSTTLRLTRLQVP